MFKTGNAYGMCIQRAVYSFSEGKGLLVRGNCSDDTLHSAQATFDAQ
jgi:hypothetical protein